jgi:hypothetical protein
VSNSEVWSLEIRRKRWSIGLSIFVVTVGLYSIFVLIRLLLGSRVPGMEAHIAQGLSAAFIAYPTVKVMLSTLALRNLAYRAEKTDGILTLFLLSGLTVQLSIPVNVSNKSTRALWFDAKADVLVMRKAKCCSRVFYVPDEFVHLLTERCDAEY